MSDHAYLIASARAIADRHDCSHPGHMLDMAAAIEPAIRADERDDALKKIGDLHRVRRELLSRAKKAEAEVSCLLRENENLRSLLTRIDADLATEDRT